jgi:hypothetical protein
MNQCIHSINACSLVPLLWQDLSTQRLSGGARIRNVFTDIFCQVGIFEQRFMGHAPFMFCAYALCLFSGRRVTIAIKADKQLANNKGRERAELTCGSAKCCACWLVRRCR